MKSSFKLLLLLAVIVGLFAGIAVDRQFFSDTAEHQAPNDLEFIEEHAHSHQTYVCPMHPEIVSDEESSCPICGMDLVAVKKDLDEKVGGMPVVSVSSTIMNALGVRTTPVIRKNIVRRVDTPGFVQQIRKGEQSKFIIPFEATVAALLFKKGEWYEAGAPLVELDSDVIFDATQLHLQLLEQDAENPPATENVVQIVENVVEEKPVEAETLVTESDNNEEATTVAVISDQQRAQLQNMGLPEEAIAEMEREMLAEMRRETGGAEDELPKEIADVETESGALNDIDVSELTSKESKASESVEGDVSEEPSIETLDDSRRYLYQLGFRPEDILQLETTKVPTSKITLYSKHPGKIMDLKVKEGDELEAGTFLFRLGGQIRATVLANAFQRDAAWIATGQNAEIRMPHVSGEVWPGVVNQGAVSINPNSQNIGIKLAFSAPLDKVRMTQYVVGTIFDELRKDVLVVPMDAVIRTENEERVVLALGEGRFQPVIVTTGVAAGGEVEIKKGLEEEDEVVVMAQFLIDSESSLKASFRRLGEN